MKYTDFTLMSDIDGTLLSYNGTIASRNLEALDRFTKAGGHFGLATGRSMQWTEQFLQSLPVNAPCVLYNGGTLYDFDTKKYLLELCLPESAKEYMVQINQDNPRIGTMVITNNEYYNVKTEKFLSAFTKTRGAEEVPEVSWRDIDGPWYKVLFITEDPADTSLQEYIDSHTFPGVRFVGTSTTLTEMLPEEVSKGFALQKLVELTEITQKQIAAIGDFYNDLEMLRFAGLGFAVEAAPEDLKQHADVVVGSCENGAIADAIEYLEQHYS